jgi:hypothetical protein
MHLISERAVYPCQPGLTALLASGAVSIGEDPLSASVSGETAANDCGVQLADAIVRAQQPQDAAPGPRSKFRSWMADQHWTAFLTSG